MSNRYPGGFILKNPIQPTTTTASGIWTVSQAAYWVKNGLWPTSGDPDFEYVSLLLPGNGTNGAQNNTFLDSSTNNFTVTRNGDTTQGSFSPYGDLWSNYFDGTGDSVSNASANLSTTGDITVEAWAYLRSASGNGDIFRIGSEASGRWVFYFNNGVPAIDRYGIGTTTFGSALALNTWHHVAFVRSSNIVTCYVNGVSIGTPTSMTGTIGNSNGFNVGGDAFDGFLSNVRVTNSAVYTGNFTPPTAPLTAISGTSLLTCQSNRFRDASTNNFAITRNGDVRVTNFAPFNPSAAYDPATNGGSGYFDGNGDYLTVGGGMPSGQGTAFTMEFWVYISAAKVNSFTGGSGSGTLDFYVEANGLVRLDNTATANILSSSAGLVPAGTWTHIALTRTTGNLYTLYINGSSAASGTNNTSMAANTTIGWHRNNAAAYLNGYISNFRVTNTLVYTSNFTPPTAPVTAISGTSLLLNFTNAGIVDAAAKNDLITVGNAQISTAQSKFGGSSMAFDGTGDYLIGQSTPDLTLGTGDFTIEFWAYINAQGNYCFYDQRTALNQVLPTIYTQSGQIHYYVSGANRITGSTLSASQWYHIALTRSGTSTRLFVNGTQVGSTYTDANNYIQSRPVIGAVGDNLSYNLNGYIDDLRITKGVARYTANFTPPTSPFLSK